MLLLCLFFKERWTVLSSTVRGKGVGDGHRDSAHADVDHVRVLPEPLLHQVRLERHVGLLWVLGKGALVHHVEPGVRLRSGGLRYEKLERLLVFLKFLNIP